MCHHQQGMCKSIDETDTEPTCRTLRVGWVTVWAKTLSAAWHSWACQPRLFRGAAAWSGIPLPAEGSSHAVMQPKILLHYREISSHLKNDVLLIYIIMSEISKFHCSWKTKEQSHEKMTQTFRRK